MKIENLKGLRQLIKLCRETGVESIRIDGIEMHLGKEPQKPSKLAKMARPGAVPTAPDKEPTIDEILSDGLTDEQLLFYSVSDKPDSSAAPEQN